MAPALRFAVLASCLATAYARAVSPVSTTVDIGNAVLGGTGEPCTDESTLAYQPTTMPDAEFTACTDESGSTTTDQAATSYTVTPTTCTDDVLGPTSYQTPPPYSSQPVSPYPASSSHTSSPTGPHPPGYTGTGKYRVEGPVFEHVFADPCIIEVNGTWYAFATSSGDIHIQMAKSADFKTWTYIAKDAMPDMSAGSWIIDADKPKGLHPWAPDVIQSSDGKFIMQFSAIGSSPRPGSYCVGAATSDSIEGPYTPEPEPFHCETYKNLAGSIGDIDSSYFHDADGSLYIVYKNTTSTAPKTQQQITTLTLREVVSSGARWGLDALPGSQPVALLENEPADFPGIEAPYISLRNGVYFLTFSAHLFSTPNYNVEYATATSARGPYTRANKPLLQTGDFPLLNGPGGVSFVKNRSGGQMVFHNHDVIPVSLSSSVPFQPSGTAAALSARAAASAEAASSTAAAAQNFTRMLWTGIADFNGKVISFN